MTSSTPCVLITGGGMGLGLAIVKKLLQGSKHSPPANVYTLTMAVSDEFMELVSKSEGRLAYAIGDVTKFEDSKKAVDEILSRWHRLDGVVVNAGITNLAPLEDLVRCHTDTGLRHDAQDALCECCSARQHAACGASGAAQAQGSRGVCDQQLVAPMPSYMGTVQVREPLTQLLQSRTQFTCSDARERRARHCVVCREPRPRRHGDAEQDPLHG